MAYDFNNLLSAYSQPNYNPNQQAYINWQNSINQAANMAQNMNPATLAGMALGQALGTWGGIQSGNLWAKHLAKLRKEQQDSEEEKKRLAQLAEQGKKNIQADNNFIQQQFNRADQLGIPKNQQIAYGLLTGSGGVDRRTYDNFTGANWMDKNYHQFDLSTVPRKNETLGNYNARMKLRNNLDWKKNLYGDAINNFNQAADKILYPFPNLDLISAFKEYRDSKQSHDLNQYPAIKEYLAKNQRLYTPQNPMQNFFKPITDAMNKWANKNVFNFSNFKNPNLLTKQAVIKNGLQSF